MNDARKFCRQLVQDAGLAPAGVELVVEPLGGGISNDVFRVTAGPLAFVAKQALGRLRVEAEWLSDVDRIHREAACQRWLTEVLAPGEVPRVLYEDAERHAYLMEAAPSEARNYKEVMLAGEVPESAAARAGDMLGRIHAAGASDPSLAQRFGDKAVFTQLRLDPYFRRCAERHADLRGELGELVESLSAAGETLVHGDYSPKNILLLPDWNILLDHEVVHYGDPRFDLGFFFCHLMLKALHVQRADDSLWAQIPAAWAAYRARYEVLEPSWLRHWGAVLLARVDGKSPAGYLTAAEDKQVGWIARPMIRGEVGSIDEVVELARSAERRNG